MKLLAAMGVLALLFSAEYTGTMQGAIRGEGTPIVFTYQQGLDSDTYTAMIGGEWFSGRAVRTDASQTSAMVFGAVTAHGVATTTTVGECHHSHGRVIDIAW